MDGLSIRQIIASILSAKRRLSQLLIQGLTVFRKAHIVATMENWKRILNGYLLLSVYFCLALAVLPPQSRASSLFDAAEIADPGDLSFGLNTEVLLSNPTSEGVEIRAKYGLTSILTTQAIVGLGSGHRKFRVGVQNVFNVFPDTQGQIGVSAILSGLYLRRSNRGVAVVTAGPMIHERVEGAAIPLNFYFAWPFEIELDSGRYFTGSQLVFGAVGGFGHWFAATDIGLGLAGRESYFALGGGYSFGRAPATGE